MPGIFAIAAGFIVAANAHSKLIGLAIGIATLAFTGFIALLRLVNTARVSVDREWLHFSRGPLPQRGAFREYAWNIVSFAADSLDSAMILGRRKTPLPLWGVMMRTQDGRAVRMPFGFVEPEHAAFVAERLAEVVADAQRVGAAYRE